MSANNQFTVGRDLTLNVALGNGQQLTLKGLTNFTADQMSTDLKSKAIDGTPRFANIPDGWRGSFQFDRQDRSIDDYFAQLEANYFNAVSTPAATILETISEQDGSVSQWRYTGVVLKFDKAGDWGGDKKVEQTISFMAARRIRVS